VTPQRTDDDPVIAPEEARLLARIREHYAPEPLAPARRSAFDAGLRERVERSRRRTGWVPALAAGLAAAALAGLLLRGTGTAPDTKPLSAATEAWENALLYGDPAAYEDAGTVPDASLPPQYAAIASTFLD
jgi:hypothetical protein